MVHQLCSPNVVVNREASLDTLCPSTIFNVNAVEGDVIDNKRSSKDDNDSSIQLFMAIACLILYFSALALRTRHSFNPLIFIPIKLLNSISISNIENSYPHFSRRPPPN